jgi:hypothetical protein
MSVAYIESLYFNDDRFSILEGEINHFQAQGHVRFCGDLNARTGQEPELSALRRTNTYLEVTAFPPQYAPLNTTTTKQPTKMSHNSCNSVASWVCT